MTPVRTWLLGVSLIALSVGACNAVSFSAAFNAGVLAFCPNSNNARLLAFTACPRFDNVLVSFDVNYYTQMLLAATGDITFSNYRSVLSDIARCSGLSVDSIVTVSPGVPPSVSVRWDAVLSAIHVDVLRFESAASCRQVLSAPFFTQPNPGNNATALDMNVAAAQCGCGDMVNGLLDLLVDGFVPRDDTPSALCDVITGRMLAKAESKFCGQVAKKISKVLPFAESLCEQMFSFASRFVAGPLLKPACEMVMDIAVSALGGTYSHLIASNFSSAVKGGIAGRLCGTVTCKDEGRYCTKSEGALSATSAVVSGYCALNSAPTAVPGAAWLAVATTAAFLLAYRDV